MGWSYHEDNTPCRSCRNVCLGSGKNIKIFVLTPLFVLLFHLGVRQAYLLGVDMKMDANYTYHFAQARHRAAIDCNQGRLSTIDSCHAFSTRVNLKYSTFLVLILRRMT